MTARPLKWAGFTLMALSTLIAGIFIIGETFADPGGWKAAGLVAGWAVPLAALATLAWYRPGWAAAVCVALTGVLIGMSIWFAVSPRGNGPTEAIFTVALAAAVAVLGLKRTGVAGVLLLVAGVVPFLVSSLGRGHVLNSLAAVSFVPVVTGILYLLSASINGDQPAPSARTNNRPGELPKAA